MAPSPFLTSMQAERVQRAGIVGYTRNIAHDMFVNGGIFDLFAAHVGGRPLDALLLDVDDGFDEAMSGRSGSWQLQMLDILFNESRGARSAAAPRMRLSPLRLSRPMCIAELLWKPPVLEFNSLADSARLIVSARARVLRHLRAR